MIGSVIEDAYVEPTLQVDLRTSGSKCRLTLRGDLRGATLMALEARVDQLGCVPCDELVVDLRRLSTVDGVGANVLLGLYHYIVARGGVLRVTGANARVTTTLESVGDGIIPIDLGTMSASDGFF
jgi:anti-anti-sigma factor